MIVERPCERQCSKNSRSNRPNTTIFYNGRNNLTFIKKHLTPNAYSNDNYNQSEHLLKQVIMKITLCSTFFYNSVTRYKICFPLFEIIILNITSSGDYFDLSNHLHR